MEAMHEVFVFSLFCILEEADKQTLSTTDGLMIKNFNEKIFKRQHGC